MYETSHIPFSINADAERGRYCVANELITAGQVAIVIYNLWSFIIIRSYLKHDHIPWQYQVTCKNHIVINALQILEKQRIKKICEQSNQMQRI
jgi:hypothetical protein